jgi:hypothetical protein
MPKPSHTTATLLRLPADCQVVLPSAAAMCTFLLLLLLLLLTA